MATPAITTATTTTGFASCAAESDDAQATAIFGFAALYRAWRACRRGKRGTRKAQRYELGLIDHLDDTARRLQQGRWHPSRACRFVVTHPKPREILAAPFGDRVVHHLLVPWLERLYEPVFIDDSFANRRGRGSHAAVARLQHFLRAADTAVRRPATAAEVRAPYYLQLDIANFFNRVDRRLLYGLLRGRVLRDVQRRGDDPRWVALAEARAMLWLARVLLTGNPARGAIWQGPPQRLARVPAHKRLANAPPGVGLAIGNLTSQFFANLYLNELDQFVKHQLKAHAYVRYVDDFVLVHADRAVLEGWREDIAAFLAARLGLALRDDGRLRPVSDGVDFLGYVVRPGYRLVRRRVVGQLRELLGAHARRLCSACGEVAANAVQLDALQATLASYAGHCRHAHARGVFLRELMRHRWLLHFLTVCVDGPLAVARCEASPAGSLAGQWHGVAARYPGHVVLIQVGNRIESWSPGVVSSGLPPAQALLRPGLGTGCAWPIAQGARLRRALRRASRPYVYVEERARRLAGGLRQRAVSRVFPFPVLPFDVPTVFFDESAPGVSP